MAKPSRMRRMKIMTLEEREEVKSNAWTSLHNEFREDHIDNRKYQLYSEIFRAWWHRYIERNEYIDFFDYINWVNTQSGISY